MKQQASATHVSPLATCPEVVHVLLVSIHMFHFRRKLWCCVRGKVSEAAHALGPGGAAQRPRGRSVLQDPRLVTLYPLSLSLWSSSSLSSLPDQQPGGCQSPSPSFLVSRGLQGLYTQYCDPAPTYTCMFKFSYIFNWNQLTLNPSRVEHVWARCLFFSNSAISRAVAISSSSCSWLRRKLKSEIFWTSDKETNLPGPRNLLQFPVTALIIIFYCRNMKI